MPPKQNSSFLVKQCFEDSPYLLARKQKLPPNPQKLLFACQSQRTTTRKCWSKFDETRLEAYTIAASRSKHQQSTTRHSSVQSRQTASTTSRHHLFVADFYASASALSEPTSESKPTASLLAQNFMAKRKRVHYRQSRV